MKKNRFVKRVEALVKLGSGGDPLFNRCLCADLASRRGCLVALTDLVAIVTSNERNVTLLGACPYIWGVCSA